MQRTTYFVQFSEPEDPGRWHTIARVDNQELAREIARLSEGGYMRTTVTSHYVGRAVSRSALRKEGRLQHAEWELGFGRYRAYGDALRERAERNLRADVTH
jgi:hypothetical protein